MNMITRFDEPLTQQALNLENKSRSNIFAWRGQFSPGLVENIIEAYCAPDSKVLDPFCGSGTVLCECSYFGLQAAGVEVNPAAYILSRTYELMNVIPAERQMLLDHLLATIRMAIPEPKALRSRPELVISDVELHAIATEIRQKLSPNETKLFEAIVILMDVHNYHPTPTHIYSTLYKLFKIIKHLPYTEREISVSMGDARATGLGNLSIDFVITSPPYINVFNYHQNYRKSAEILGWDLLKIAKSEIGANRANRSNRFFTVIQYCLDMASTLLELHRVCKIKGKLVLVVGHESRVLGVPFFNADLISLLATSSGLFSLPFRQHRVFKNKFGKLIREDLLHLENIERRPSEKELEQIARRVAESALKLGLDHVSVENKPLLNEAIESVHRINGTPLYVTGEKQM